jgi:hypothetical protein
LGSNTWLPLVLWSKDVFAKIGNSLGSYYEVDLSFQDTGYFGMDGIPWWV